MPKKSELKSDKFRKARGGYSRLLILSCAKCGKTLCGYQKDGPGILKRLYIDRIRDSMVSIQTKDFSFIHCEEILGVRTTYKKENRLAYRLFAGAVAKRIDRIKNSPT